ncbi:3-hydroxyacyl-CoA dehydrogenase NAD-binding domain-containing protein [Rhodococcus erythropolis]|uniref:3-hydroxyacyl-CoA dehydrogenase NAD-binding domain-containing protein n=1 Tax=Rhodococcus erythropolis TaxID=1833 RepID=UPI0008791054|nr:3-hydroxyacyl-CoA dehydrogenase NAD-binding domain-containing protein [Rhodococcus erythropolis]
MIGAGLMGHSIAGVCAAAGATVTVHDADTAVLKQVPDRVRRQLDSLGRDQAATERIQLVAIPRSRTPPPTPTW